MKIQLASQWNNKNNGGKMMEREMDKTFSIAISAADCSASFFFLKVPDIKAFPGSCKMQR